MLPLFGNIAIAVILAAAILGGVALFWIARQDDSRMGRLIGLLSVAIGAVTGLYLTTGHHWL
jgi:disulfide bond formation protein DsbB